MPLRARITLWVLAVFAIVHVTVTVVVVLYMRVRVASQMENDLALVVSDYRSGAEFPAAREVVRSVMLDQRVHRWGPNISLMIERDGELGAISAPFDRANYEELLASVRSGVSGSEDRGVRRTERFLYARAPFDDGRDLVIAAPRASIDREIAPVALVLLITLPVGLFSTGIASWYVGGFAIKPLREVREFASHLTAENLPEGIDIEDSAPEVQQLREELEEAMNRLEMSYEAQARFLANVSHELKTPISVVRTESQVLLSGDPNREELLAFAEGAGEEMERLGRMVESFLLLTRVKVGSSRVKPKPFGANEVLMETVTHCVTMARQHNVYLRPDLYDGEDELEISGSSDLLQTALDNLVRNAIRFSPSDRAIDVSVAQHNGHAIFAVRDYGPGVPEELLGRLFEPFSQAQEERRRGRGTGLGLQIAQGIAELHAGTIGVENLEDGCRFELRVPTTKEAGDRIDEPRDEPQNEPKFTVDSA